MQKLDKGKLSKFTQNSFEIWLDGGHNIEASSIIQKTFKIWDRENIFVILGMSIGKDPAGFLNGIIKKHHRFIFTSHTKPPIYTTL